jgi:hypothetical protein
MPAKKQKENFTDNRLLKYNYKSLEKRTILFDDKQPGLALQIDNTIRDKNLQVSELGQKPKTNKNTYSRQIPCHLNK